jgi:hypothetical protein
MKLEELAGFDRFPCMEIKQYRFAMVVSSIILIEVFRRDFHLCPKEKVLLAKQQLSLLARRFLRDLRTYVAPPNIFSPLCLTERNGYMRQLNICVSRKNTAKLVSLFGRSPDYLIPT